MSQITEEIETELDSDEDKSFGQLLDEYQNQEKLWNLEGDTGLNNLNKICNAIGYSEDGFKYGSSLEKFLSDNPGACEAIVGWLERTDLDQFKKELISHLNESEDEEDESED